MEHVNIINRIIEAEQRARQIAGEAQEKREHLRSDLQREQEELKASFQNRAERRVSKVEENEKALVQEQLRAMDVRFEQSMSEMEKQFAENKEAWAEKIFSMIAGR